jgi:putative transposase
MADENRDWGYRRIQGALSNPEYELPAARSRSGTARGIEPAPERIRKTTGEEFLSRHWELFAAMDFFTVEVWTRRGLQRFIVLFFMELSTRKVQIAGIAGTAKWSVAEPGRAKSHGFGAGNPDRKAIPDS